MSFWPKHKIRRTTDLSGLWDFDFLGGVDPLSVDPSKHVCSGKAMIPSCPEESPELAGKRGVCVYRTKIWVDPGMRSKIYFGGVGLWCAIYLDGVKLGEHFNSYESFVLDIPASQKEERELAVVLDTRFNTKLNPLQEYYYDFYQHGGIIRPVILSQLPACSVREALVKIRKFREGLIDLDIRFDGKVPDSIPARISIDGVKVFDSLLKIKGSAATVSLKTPEPSIWSPESPNLHVFEIAIPEDDFIGRYGLREISVKGEQILLNGSPVKIKGVAYHAIHPEFGAAIGVQNMCSDLKLMKDMGCNFIRAVHYPHDARLFDLCDEMGFMVWEETLGWNNRERHYADPVFCQSNLDGLRRMITESYNHPSIIIWSFLNEGFNPPRAVNGPEFFTKMFNLAKELDPSRLVTLPNTCFEDSWSKMPPFDIVCYNIYPGWYYYELPEGVDKEISEWREKSRKIAGKPIPFLISEIGADAIYGWRDRHETRWSEQYQAKLLDEACRIALERDDVAGLSIWLFADYRGGEELDEGHGHILRRGRGYNNKGVVDEYRRPKLSYECVKRRFRNIR